MRNDGHYSHEGPREGKMYSNLITIIVRLTGREIASIDPRVKRSVGVFFTSKCVYS